MPCSHPLRLLLAVCLGTTSACARNAATATQAPHQASDWVQAPLMGDVPGDAGRLEDLAGGDLQARVVRLDRLLDLFDAARFAEDEYARETLWAALGGHPSGIGTAATREAIARMLQEAMALEEDAAKATRPLPETYQRMLADAIMLLSTDLQGPATAEDLSIQTLAYRQLVQRGHERVTDNARWRIYDHVRGILAGATEAAPEHRLDVAVQALYVQRESVEPWLEDTAPHAKPPPPRTETLLELLAEQREALAEEPRWRPVVTLRQQEDAKLQATAATVLPAPRDPAWPSIEVPRGTGRPERWAPVVVATEGTVTVDAGRPQARKLRSDKDIAPLAQALQSALAQDGRGVLLLAVDPTLPSSELHTLLRAIRRAQTSRLELAVSEPRLQDEGVVLTALPLEVARTADATAGMQAMVNARIAVHLSGRGPRFTVDGRWLSDDFVDPADLPAAVRTIRAAYPRAPLVRLTLSSDVAYEQLVDLLVALQGGPDPAFDTVGWWAGGAPQAEPPKRQHDQAVRRRAALHPGPPSLSQPYPLKARDQKRLEAFTAEAAACVPELESKVSSGKVVVRLSLQEGRVQGATVIEPAAPKSSRTAVADCFTEEAMSLRLREHRDAFDVTATYPLRPNEDQ